MTEQFPVDDNSFSDSSDQDDAEVVVNPVAPTDRTAVARIASREVLKIIGSEVTPSESDPGWHVPNQDLVMKPVKGVFLGAIPNASGWGSTYRDKSITPTGEGFKFVVGQNSAGLTYIAASAEEENTVEAFEIDEKTGLPVWKATGDRDSDVTVASDYGKAVTHSAVDIAKEDTWGNPGGQVGVIRVTTPDGQVKYFAMGADFQGREDAWNVTGMYVPVEPQNIEALTAMADGTNQRLVLEAAPFEESTEAQPRDEDDYYIDGINGHVSPDPLYEERKQTKTKSEELINDIKDTLLPQLLQKGIVVDASSSYDKENGKKVYRFASPQHISGGRIATLEFEVPTDPSKIDSEMWGMKLKMAHDEGLRLGDRGYVEVSVHAVPANKYNPKSRIDVSGHQASNGQRGSFGLYQRHSNTMAREVTEATQAVDEADQLIRSLAAQQAIESV